MANNKNKLGENSSRQMTKTDQGIIKRYIGPGVMQRWQTELQLIETLEGQLPLPTLLNHTLEAEIHIQKMTGLPATDLITTENSPLIMAALGNALQKLQTIPVQKLHKILRGSGDVLTHGDYCLPNFIFVTQPLSLEAITEWEWAHLGEKVEDPAWMEWFVRMNMGKLIRDLPVFYEAYGVTPIWGERKDAMIMQVKRHLEFAEMAGEKRTIQKWQNWLQLTSRFQAS